MEEGKAVNHIIHMEERIIDLLKSLKKQKKFQRKIITYIHQIQNQGLVKFISLWRMEFQLSVQFRRQPSRYLPAQS